MVGNPTGNIPQIKTGWQRSGKRSYLGDAITAKLRHQSTGYFDGRLSLTSQSAETRRDATSYD